MSRQFVPDVTLAYADPAILQCWEEMVKQGAKCSLLLKHSNGKIETILKSTLVNPKAKVQSSAPPAPFSVERKKRNKGSKKKRLEDLHAVDAPLHPVLAEQTPNDFKCDFCDFSTSSQNGLKIH